MNGPCEFVILSDRILVDYRDGKTRIVLPDLPLSPDQAMALASLGASSVSLRIEIKENQS